MNLLRFSTVATMLFLVSAAVGADNAPPANVDVKKHVTALKDPYWPNQYRAIEALGKLGPAAADAVPDLVAALDSKEATVRAAAAEAIGKIDPEARGVPAALAALLKDRQDSVREAAARALGGAGPSGRDAVPALATALEDANAGVRVAAARSLGRLGIVAQPAEPALRRAARSEDRTLSAAAARALEETAPPPAVWPALLTLKAAGAACFSPDGRRVIVGEAVWDASTGKQLLAVRGTDEMLPRCLSFSPDGRQIAGSLPFVGQVRTWDATTGEPLARAALQVASSQLDAIQYSPDGRLLAVLDEEDAVTLWEARTGRKVRTLYPGGTRQDFGSDLQSRHDLAFSPDGRCVAAVVRHEDRASVKVWNLAREKPTLDLPLPSPTGVAFSPDGRRLAVTTNDGTVRLIELATNKEALKFGLRGCACGAAFSPDGRLLLTGWQRHWSGDDASALIVWDTATGEARAVLRGLRGSIASVAFSPDGRRALAGGSPVRIWDVTATSLTPREHRHMNPEESVAGLAFREGGETLVVLRRGAHRTEDIPVALDHWAAVDCWDLARNESKRTLAPVDTNRGLATTLSDDGRTLVRVTARYDGRTGAIVSTEVKMWDPIAAQELATFPGPASALWSAGFGAGGKRLALNFAPPLFRDEGDGRVVSHPRGPEMYRRALVLSPDGRSFAARRLRGHSSDPEPVTIWEVATGRERLRLPCDDYVHGLTYRPDGKVLAGIVGPWKESANSAGKVRLWDVSTGVELRAIAGHPGPILCQAFSPDGKLLATGGADETLRLWNVDNGKELLRLDNLGDAVRFVAFSPDGSKIAASADRICVWNVAELLAQRRPRN